MVETHALRWSMDGRTILDQVDLAVRTGEIFGVVGPNGSGKSSLLRCLHRTQRPSAGVVRLGGRDVWTLRASAVARQIAVVLQDGEVSAGTTVAQLVELGRLPHQGLWGRHGVADERAVTRAVAATGVEPLWHRVVDHLSGGERQSAQLARALAQEPSVLMLDEPTNHLDLHHQESLLQLVRGLGLTTVVVLHDLSMASRLCDRLMVLDHGRVQAVGAPVDVLTADRLAEVWRVQATIMTGPSGDPLISPTGPIGPTAAMR